MANLAALAMLAAGAVAHEAPEPSALGLTPQKWLALSMTVLIIIALGLKVPGMLTSGLDASIAEIRKQLEEAKALRAEAEALRAEYVSRIANAEKDAAAMIDHARGEAEAIVSKAQADTAVTLARREKIATDKIEAAERAAIAELRAKTAEAATAAARRLIAAHHTAKADKTLVDEAIGGI